MYARDYLIDDREDRNYNPEQHELVRSYEYFLSEYERDMHESYRLDLKIQDLKIKLERKSQKYKKNRNRQSPSQYKKLEDELYYNNRILSEVLDENKRIKHSINKLRLEKLSTSTHVEKTRTELLRSNSEANILSRNRVRYDNTYEMNKDKIMQTARILNGNSKETRAFTSRLKAELTLASKFKRYSTPNIKAKASHTTAPVTRIMNTKWIGKTKNMNARVEERQHRTRMLKEAMQKIMIEGKLKSYEFVVESFIRQTERERHLEKKICLMYDKADKFQEKTAQIMSSIQSQHQLNTTQHESLKSIYTNLKSKETHLFTQLTYTLSRLENFTSSLLQAINTTNSLISLLNLQDVSDSNLLSKIKLLEPSLNELFMSFKYTKNPQESIFGLFTYHSLPPKHLNSTISIPVLDLEPSEALEDKLHSPKEIPNISYSIREF